MPGYINNGLATHDEREMPRHISSYCRANCANIPNMRLHIRAERMCAYTRARDGVYGWWWRGGFIGGSIRTARSRCYHSVWKPLLWWQIYATMMVVIVGLFIVVVVVKSAKSFWLVVQYYPQFVKILTTIQKVFWCLYTMLLRRRKYMCFCV